MKLFSKILARGFVHWMISCLRNTKMQRSRSVECLNKNRFTIHTRIKARKIYSSCPLFTKFGTK